MRLVCVCDECGEDIYEGDRFLNLPDYKLCLACMEEHIETAEYDEYAD